MAAQPVEFVYYIGTHRDFLSDMTATLEGSWNDQGFYSDSWSVVPMEKTKSTSEGPCFRATFPLNQSQTGVEFKWGVRLHNPHTGLSSWAIPTEINSTQSRQRFLSFRFLGEAQTEQYFLTQCRRLGANKVPLADGSQGRRFRIWAPNAQHVELVFGFVWNVDDPLRRPVGPGRPVLREKSAGGYIADDHVGLHPDLRYSPIAMTPTEDNLWEVAAEHASLQGLDLENQLYMYRVTRDDQSIVYRTDLYSRYQAGRGSRDPKRMAEGGLLANQEGAWNQLLDDLAGRVSCSVTHDPEKIINRLDIPVWPEPASELLTHDEFWADEFTDIPVPDKVEDLIVYELHLGALGFGKEGPGTIKDALALLDHISGLNVNAVELLPLSESAGDARNWGYATSHYFAIEHHGGHCDEFKHFVKACHRRGLAVIMDVVYNHYDHNAERAQRYYDSPQPEHDIYYWYEGQTDDYAYLREQGKPQWQRGGYIENFSTGDAPAFHEGMVRSLFISSAVALVEDFHIDGFRVDQTTSIHQYNRLRANGRQVANANIFGAKFLRELGRTLRLLKPDIIFMAEDHSNWDEVVKPVHDGGMGFNARWYADYYHHLSGDTQSGDKARLLHSAAVQGGDGQLRMDVFARALWETQFQKVVYNESHDEAGNSKGPFLDEEWTPENEAGKRYTSERTINVAVNSAPLEGDTRKYAEARCRFAWGVTVLSAGTPMFLFGEEVGAEKRFKYNAVLANKEDLHGLRSGSGNNLYRFYSEINGLRQKYAALRSRHIDVVHVRNDTRVIVFRRWDKDESCLIFASLADQPYQNGYIVNSIRIPSGLWREVFNSDSVLYGGDNIGNGGRAVTCQTGRMEVIIPFAGFVVFRKEN